MSIEVKKPERFTWDVPFEDEIPMAKVPPIPFMSENYCFTGIDAKSGLAFFLHMGRWVKNPAIFRELLLFYLPDGSYLLHQSFGRGDCSKGPFAACLSLTVEDPGRKIAIRFSGPIQRITPERLTNGREVPVSYDRLDLNLSFDANAPFWYFKETDNTTWSSWHTEQQGLVTGDIDHDGTRYAFNGRGYRDHSRGVRQLSEWRGHTWIQGQFEDGSSFAVYQLWQIIEGSEVEALSEAKILQENRFISAKVSATPRLFSTATAYEPFTLTLDSELGPMVINGKPLSIGLFSVAPGFSHFMPGIPVGVREFPMTCVEQPVEYRIGERTAYGWTERSYNRLDQELVFNASAVHELRAAKAARRDL
jgi:hypothetical protein